MARQAVHRKTEQLPVHASPERLSIHGPAVPVPSSEHSGAIAVPGDMLSALRSDHAGETGAVFIYRGILAMSRDKQVREFARQHLVTEQQHLLLMDQLLPVEARSRLLPVWRAAGWMTGALPAVFGAASVYRTIEAVETFVDRHYASQTERLRHRPADSALRDVLEQCRRDELTHRNDARGRLGKPTVIGRAWSALVGIGSKLGVFLASRL